MKKVLIVIDMQKDFIDGALYNKDAIAIVDKVIDQIKDAKKQKIDVIYTLDTHDDNYLETKEGQMLPVVHCIKNSDGWKLYPGIDQGGEKIEKPTFGSTKLAELIQERGYDDITLIGVCTDICVVSNALLIKAFNHEATIKVIAGACAGTTPSNHQDALTTMKNCHIIVE